MCDLHVIWAVCALLCDSNGLLYFIGHFPNMFRIFFWGFLVFDGWELLFVRLTVLKWLPKLFLNN